MPLPAFNQQNNFFNYQQQPQSFPLQMMNYSQLRPYEHQPYPQNHPSQFPYINNLPNIQPNMPYKSPNLLIMDNSINNKAEIKDSEDKKEDEKEEKKMSKTMMIKKL